ncbi:MAG: RluA family pseudouridine synthase [Candidatus Omnitrophica bacterium]|nr:RluA family pseudouridine synthase [Candidatus Omnitrophota bacterium]
MPIQSLKAKAQDKGVRLDVYLASNLNDIPSRNYVKKLIDNGHVKVNEAIVKPHHKMNEGETVIVNIPADFGKPQYISPENIPLDIFFEDEYLIVVNKPIGMIVHPAQGRYDGTLVNALLHHSVNLSDVNSDIRPGIVHRLDQDTSGLILVAKDNITHAKLAKQFERREIKKKYVALVEGKIEFDEGVIDEPIGMNPTQRDKKAVRYDEAAKEAVTYYKVLQRGRNVTLVSLLLKTGRTHQLRVHMSFIGYPILGDKKYGSKLSFSRLALHAQSIGFVHPATKKFIEFSSKTPPEFLDRVKG